MWLKRWAEGSQTGGLPVERAEAAWLQDSPAQTQCPLRLASLTPTWGQAQGTAPQGSRRCCHPRCGVPRAPTPDTNGCPRQGSFTRKRPGGCHSPRHLGSLARTGTSHRKAHFSVVHGDALPHRQGSRRLGDGAWKAAWHQAVGALCSWRPRPAGNTPHLSPAGLPPRPPWLLWGGGIFLPRRAASSFLHLQSCRPQASALVIGRLLPPCQSPGRDQTCFSEAQPPRAQSHLRNKDSHHPGGKG